MGKGAKHGASASKHSHYSIKKRCSHLNCKKKAKVIINGIPYCKIHYKEV